MKRGLSQEGLKLIACITMLLDHVGAVFVPGYTLRIIGRLAFPIFCFLLAEGAHYTRNPKKYALRLTIGALLSEFPFDILFYGKFTWQHQSVMVTLLLGYLAIVLMEKCPNVFVKFAVSFPFFLAAQWLQSDYGSYGVGMIVLFSITRELLGKEWIQTLGLAVICAMMPSVSLSVFGFSVSIQLFAVAAMIPISLYSGRKATQSKAVQWGFYLFYPVHLAVLYLILLAAVLMLTR